MSVSVSPSGTHIFQYMYGCEWDDQNDETDGFRQYGYDGEDFIAWDMKTNTFVTTKQQAFATMTKWNNDKAELDYRKNYLNQECVDWLKKYVTYGRSSLARKGKRTRFNVCVFSLIIVLTPSVSILFFITIYNFLIL